MNQNNNLNRRNVLARLAVMLLLPVTLFAQNERRSYPRDGLDIFKGKSMADIEGQFGKPDTVTGQNKPSLKTEYRYWVYNRERGYCHHEKKGYPVSLRFAFTNGKVTKATGGS